MVPRSQSSFGGLFLEGDDSSNDHGIVAASAHESPSEPQSNRSSCSLDDIKIGAGYFESDECNMMLRGLSPDENDTADIMCYSSEFISACQEAGKDQCQSAKKNSNCHALKHPGNNRLASNYFDNMDHLDYYWLSARCDGDSTFVCEVLKTLDQDGSLHVAQLRKTLSEHNFHEAVFHAVFPTIV
jgi:hypothetical protein